MKKTILYLIAAITIVSAASCTKDEQPNINEQSGARVIELIFDNQDATKVGVNDRTPQWQANDSIWLSNGTNSETVKLKESDINNNVAKITTTLEGTLYAVYPASAQNGYDGGKIGFKIPTSTDGTFGNAHISVAVGMTTLTFKNVVSILKFDVGADTLINVSSSVNIAGEFKVTYGDTPSIEAGTNQAKSIMVSASDTRDTYIAVASGVAFSALEFTAIKTATNWAYKKSSSATTTAINTIYPIGKVSDWTYVTNGSLWAKFSTNASIKVRFSKGNLQYQAGDGTTDNPKWQFAANQYDYIGNAVGNNVSDETTRSKQSGWIDLFGWGATGHNSYGQHPYSISTNYSDYKTEATASSSETLTIANKADWGYCMGGETSVWRTLSGGDSGEWYYLLSTRSVNGGTGEGKSYQRATIRSDVSGGVYGMIIYPDNYTSQTTAISYTQAEWAAMEVAGCVFLPAAGRRYGSDVGSVGGLGVYRSSSALSEYEAYVLGFESAGVGPSGYDSRCYGESVRLVSAAQ